MSKGVRIVGSLLGGLIGVGLIAGGGFGLRHSGSMYTADYEVESQAGDAGFPEYSSTQLAVVIRSANGTVDSKAVSQIVGEIATLPDVKSAGSMSQFTNRNRTAILLMVPRGGADRDKLVDGVNHLKAPEGTTLTVLGPADPPSWREPVSWAGLGVGALAIFASGAMAFTGPRRTPAVPIDQPTGFPATGQVPGFPMAVGGQVPQHPLPAGGHTSGFPGTYPAPGPQPSQGAPAFQPVPYNAPVPPAS